MKQDKKDKKTQIETKVEQVSHLEQSETVDLCSDSTSSCND